MSRRLPIVLAASAAVAGTFAVLARGAAISPAVTAYGWAQPGCAPPADMRVEPTLPKTIVPMPVGLTLYRWAQPGCAWPSETNAYVR
jgi:hypothetical protein